MSKFIHILHSKGSLLKEDHGWITPANLLEVMIYMRGEVLSPDNYPETDRLRKLVKLLLLHKFEIPDKYIRVIIY